MLDPSWQGFRREPWRGEGANVEKPKREAEVEDSESSASPKGWEARSLPTTGSTRAQTWHYKFARRLLQV